MHKFQHKIWVVTILALALGWLGGGCESSDNVKFVTAADAGARISLGVDDELEICLAGNPTTGYQWEIGAYDRLILEHVAGPEYVAAASGGGTVGTGGRYYTRFKAAAPGETAVTMFYRQAGGAAPSQTFAITAVVE